jgi:O-antigen ligase
MRHSRHDDPDVETGERPRSRRLSLGRIAGAMIAGAFFILLAAGALPMGANRDWAWTPMALLIGILAILSAFGWGGRAALEVSVAERWPLRALIACFAIVVAVALLQMSPWAPLTASAVYYAKAAQVLGHAHAPVPTLAVDASWETLARIVATGLVFLTARALCASPGRARMLLLSLVASAVVVVGYGFAAQRSTHSCYLGNYLKKQGEYMASTDHCLMSGTFVNSNSFGCYLGMALIAAIAVAFADRRPRRGSEEDDDGNPLIAWVTGPRILLLGLAFLFMGGLLISGSRGAFAATTVAGLALFFLLSQGRWKSRTQLARTTLVLLLVAGAAGLIAGGAMIHKFSTLPSADSTNRLVIWAVSFDAVAQSPWLGWGLGSYPDIYTILQPDRIPQINDKAHSTPIETIVELGIPGAVFAMLLVLLPWWICLRAARQRQRHRYLPVAAFAVSAVAIVHSTIDFSLQMPAIGFMVSALLGMGWAQMFTRPEPPAWAFTSGHQ